MCIIKNYVFDLLNKKVQAHIERDDYGMYRAFAATLDDDTLYPIGKNEKQCDVAFRELARIVLKSCTDILTEALVEFTVTIYDMDPRVDLLSIPREQEIVNSLGFTFRILVKAG